MSNRVESLSEERTRLTERLKHLNVNSPGRERIVERIEAIRHEMEREQNKAI